MAITNGYGEQNKICLLAKYRLYPVMHAVLLQGRSMTCCCGQPIVDEFYQFDAIDRAGHVLNVLFASNACTNEFARLSLENGFEPITLLPLFNPTQHLHDERRAGSGMQEHSVEKHPLNAEVEEAIYLALMCEETSPYQRRFFTNLLVRMRRNPACPIMDWEIKAMNASLSKGGKCMATVLDAQRQANPELKHYTFPEISAALRREAARTGLRIHCNL